MSRDFLVQMAYSAKEYILYMGVRAVLNKTSTHDPLGVLHVMIFKGRLRSNGEPFTGFRYMKG